MLGINEMNQELVRAFNINLCYNDIAITNLTVQNLHGKDHIVISFDKNMDSKQCIKYLNNVKEKIIKRSYRDEKAAGVSYNLKFFPFAFNTKHLPRDDKGRKKFSVEIDEGVVFNLKCYLAKALAGDVKEKMGRKFGVQYAKEHIYGANFDRNSYLYCMLFHDQGLQKDFVDLFSAKIRRYENAPSDYLEENGNLVYIKKGIFDDIEFIKDIEAYNASLICRDFLTPSSKNKVVENLKFPIISFILKTGIPVHSVIRTSYKGSNEDSVLIPIVAQNGKVDRLLDDNDAYRISSAFDMEILNNVSESISARLPKSGSFDGVMYGIDFADVDIAYCVMNKIIESSVINKDHELSIDPQLPFRALSPAQSPFNSPTHAEQSGFRTPPNKRKKDTDSGYDSNSPPKPKDSVAHSSSGGPGPSTELLDMEWESPTRSQDGALKDSPRRGSEKLLLHNHVNLAGTSGELPPSSYLSYTAVSQRRGKCVSAAQNVQAGSSAWSLSAPSAGFPSWSPSGPSSSKGANKSGSAWTSTRDHDSLPPLPPLIPISGSVLGSRLPVSFTSTRGPGSSPPPLIPSSGGLVPRFQPPTQVSSSKPSSSRGAQAGANISGKEEKLIEALLYTFNLMNYTLGGVYTNFFAKDGEIVSLLHDNVDREKYLQAVIDYIIEEYCEDEEKARKLYDLDEFPFKLNCEEKQGKQLLLI